MIGTPRSGQYTIWACIVHYNDCLQMYCKFPTSSHAIHSIPIMMTKYDRPLDSTKCLTVLRPCYIFWCSGYTTCGSKIVFKVIWAHTTLRLEWLMGIVSIFVLASDRIVYCVSLLATTMCVKDRKNSVVIASMTVAIYNDILQSTVNTARSCTIVGPNSIPIIWNYLLNGAGILGCNETWFIFKVLFGYS